MKKKRLQRKKKFLKKINTIKHKGITNFTFIQENAGSENTLQNKRNTEGLFQRKFGIWISEEKSSSEFATCKSHQLTLAFSQYILISPVLQYRIEDEANKNFCE